MFTHFAFLYGTELHDQVIVPGIEKNEMICIRAPSDS